MEEISFKPSFKIESFLLFLIFLYSIIILILGIGLSQFFFGLLFSLYGLILVISSIINKKFTVYTLTTQNEIMINYKFISKRNKIYRVDQITSFKLTQNLFQKWANLGTISFGVFGENEINIPRKPNNNLPLLISSLRSIENYEEIYNNFFNLLNLDKNSKIILNEKPSFKPSKFWTKLVGFFVLVMGIIFPLLLIKFNSFNSLPTLSIFIISLILSLFLFIFMLLFLADVYLFKSANYNIRENYLEKNFNYYFSRLNQIIPYNKITNTTLNKNLINYKFFKVGSFRVFTGGSLDPVFKNIVNFNTFTNLVNHKYKNSELNIDILNSSISEEEIVDKPKYITKPKSSFFISFIFWLSITFIPLFLVGLFIKDFRINAFILFILYLVLIILRYILYQNTSYEFYEDKIVDKSGILNIKTKVIYFKNLKYVALSRNLFFERILKQGTIHLYTAGTNGEENEIQAIDEFDEIYTELKGLLD